MRRHDGLSPAALVPGRHAEMIALVCLQIEGVVLRDWSSAQLYPECSLATKPRLDLVGDHRRTPGDWGLLPT